MAIISRHIDPSGLIQSNLNIALPLILGQHAASATNALYTRASAWSASSLNSTVAPGTNIDFPRNLNYKLTPSTGSSSLYSGGTIIAIGSDPLGSAISESVAMTALNTISAGVVGTAIFGSVGTISFSNVTIHTASSSASTALSFHLGNGNIVGMFSSLGQNRTNGVPYAWIGTAAQPGSFTVKTGNVGTCGISFSNALTAASNVMIVQHWLK